MELTKWYRDNNDDALFCECLCRSEPRRPNQKNQRQNGLEHEQNTQNKTKKKRNEAKKSSGNEGPCVWLIDIYSIMCVLENPDNCRDQDHDHLSLYAFRLNSF